ncbi:MAG: hypothetical protein A2845_05165 [Candidatus Lloydbacteria bacterium RIFCSPHIGHO2_01_FULL_49_22]|uniref:Uncharacterized protein n=1 Tax=Candidatus Lloydbacteria bacterium RIFCSPHIGHO2_01_FULL_49_22 TaxID=1798658 RepID=A0A1G2CU14_9BACT|nr:MAG: hypothetical protein A2845_05165 [Candidatus Lloydbacteria bacterium RIFCSPHIGHO2_01_FULL_49_22]OGZ09518.1 MAG: hypothetical protein A3C14_01720 [Candidatus Lloydbacteria bacterium RIFCSPHIGHO2_02_FULL_50_18]
MAHTLDDKTTLAAVRVLIKREAHYSAVRTLIAHSRSQPHVVTCTIRILLSQWNAVQSVTLAKSLEPIFFAIDLLAIARPGKALIDSVIKEAARAGLCGYFPDLPKRVLGRNPDETEMTLLISNYVKNKAVQSSTAEAKLVRMAESYCSKHVAEEQIARIRAFKKEWDEDISL